MTSLKPFSVDVAINARKYISIGILQDALADLRELVIIFDRPMHLLVRRPQLEKTGLENVL